MADPSHFACLRRAARTWTVAAVHGEAARLAALHRLLAEHMGVEDNLVYLGNLLGRGPAVGETVDELLGFRRALLSRPFAYPDDIVYLRGGQEEMWHKLLQIQFAVNPGEVIAWMLDNGVGPTIAAYGGTAEEATAAARSGPVAMSKWTSRLQASMRQREGHNALMSVLRRAAYSADNGLLFVSAGIDVSRPLSEQRDSFWWGGAGFDDIREPYGNFKRVVRGFDPRHPGVRVNATTATIDGGCGFDGPLIAACFDAEGQLLETLEA